MTTLAVSAAQFIGNSLVQVGATVAQTAASQAISNIFDDRTFEGPRLESFHLQTSRDGAPMSRVYGRIRLAGQVIWASRIRETSEETRVGSGKGGGPTQKTYSYTISFAIGLCEGEILGVDRIWANGAPLQTRDLTIRVNRGQEDQHPDPIIAATESSDVPAFRGTAYLVFEDFPLDGFGGQLPQINAEVISVPKSEDSPRLENLIQSVNLLPGSGEYAYATSIVEETPQPGVSRPINMNNLTGKADIELALDQLQTQLPNCKNVSIIASWFGTDLRCGACEIKPGVESRDRVVPDNAWRVGSDTRGNAYLVSRDADGRPNYGGSPSDASLIEAIRALKQRGLEVTLYPFVLMDIPEGSGLPMPGGGGQQPAFPWRGRITGTEDKNTETNAQIEAFFGAATAAGFSNTTGSSNKSSTDYRYRNFILHHANLCRRAGGVDRFILGSEMRGLTTLRDINNTFPAVTKLAELASDVRQILGPQTGITYAADWSEYFGFHPQDNSGDVFFHLDELWASDAIDAIGIDAYFPLSDWRENISHLDQEISENGYDKSYLASQIEGGEGYDYFYANNVDRDAQSRSPITDGAAQKDWVFRYKDIRNWWSNLHYNRIGGTEVSPPTNWVPQSKPVWLLEVGCPAIHNGANQPNVFSDPKSSEDKLPYYSDGYRDDLIQRNYLEALISYWADIDNNPDSSVYSGRMIDTKMVSVWAWDARPYPDFPARLSVWSDGNNWQTGHWISGRMGLVSLSSVITDLTTQSGVENIDVSRVSGLLQGYHIDRPMSARAALTPLFETYNLQLSERDGKLQFSSRGQTSKHVIEATTLVTDDRGNLIVERDDPETQLKDLRVHFIDVSNDYQLGSVAARNLTAQTVRVKDLRVPIAMDRSFANYLADTRLTDHHLQMERVSFSLPPKAALNIHVGDRIHFPDQAGEWEINAIDAGTVYGISAYRIATDVSPYQGSRLPSVTTDPLWVSRPLSLGFDLPGNKTGCWVGSIMDPFEPHNVSIAGQKVSVSGPLWMGASLTTLWRGPVGRWDFGPDLEFFMPRAALSGLPDDVILAGENRFAIETDAGWEILQCADITLIAPNIYRARRFLRGLNGSDADMVDAVPAGARIIYLDQGLTPVTPGDEWIGEVLTATPTVQGRAGDPSSFTYNARALRPYAPVHLTAECVDGALNLRWIRRSRVNGDGWVGADVPLGEDVESYRVQRFDAEQLVQTWEVEQPHFILPEPFNGRYTVAQFSTLYGWGAEAEILINTAGTGL
ncbi:glycoside hydrolase/phage tail family protein [Litorimonas sp. RW-G-Af-16]|uniref:baseplate multidomain protein megatron n=1 Tax=Litorimonas sp. RW-G-Af-16 TaxID=3241168 RepID=UPI003AB055F1